MYRLPTREDPQRGGPMNYSRPELTILGKARILIEVIEPKVRLWDMDRSLGGINRDHTKAY